MSEVFGKVNDSTGHNAAFLYINKEGFPRISVAYDLLLLNRDVEGGRFGQVFVEFGYSVTNPVDNFNKKIGRQIASINLKDGGMTKRNYNAFYLGVGYDIEAVEFTEKQYGVKLKVPKGAVPLRLVGDDNPRPWIIQSDFDLTSIVKRAVLQDYNENHLYK